MAAPGRHGATRSTSVRNANSSSGGLETSISLSKRMRRAPSGPSRDVRPVTARGGADPARTQDRRNAGGIARSEGTAGRRSPPGVSGRTLREGPLDLRRADALAGGHRDVHQRLALPAVDRDVRAVEEARAWRGHEGDDVGDLLRSADAPERDRGDGQLVRGLLVDALVAGERLLKSVPAIG